MIWGIKWIQKNSIDGNKEHLIYENGFPAMFKTKKECKEFIDSNYGYIKFRKDLRRYPYGWRLPQPVKLEIKIKVNGIAKKASNRHR